MVDFNFLLLKSMKIHQIEDQSVLVATIVIFVQSICLALIYGIFSLFDPLGVKSASDLHSEKLFNRFIGSAHYVSPGQDLITVFLIDDKYIKKQGTNWPLPYDQLSGVIAEILLNEPKAIFIDLLFQHKHGADEELERLLSTLEEFNPQIPIFYPVKIKENYDGQACNPSEPMIYSESVDSDSVIKGFYDSKLHKTFINWSGCGNRYPLFLGENSLLKTPAFSLFKYYSKNKLNNKANLSFDEPMRVVWGGAPSNKQQELMELSGVPCNQVSNWTHFMKVIQHIFDSNTFKGQRQKCMYIDTISPLLLLSSTPKTQEYLNYFLQNRFVFIGANIDGVNDDIKSPVNGKVPGVFLHAMAFDNLIKYEDQYSKQMKWTNKIILDSCVVFVVLLVLELAYFFSIKLKYKTSFIMFFIKIILPLVICFIVVYTSWYKYNFTAIDWISISLVGFVYNPISLKVRITNILIEKLNKGKNNA